MGQTFAPFKFLLYLCVVFARQKAGSTQMCKKKYCLDKKMHRLFANVKKFVYLCATFSVENDGCCWQHLHTVYSNKTNLIRRNLASFKNRKKLANVSAHICVLLLLYLRFRQCESLCERTARVVFFLTFGAIRYVNTEC